MGITKLLSITPGFVTSVSPAGVRVHTIGGLCVSDNDITGMVCGTPHPEVGSTHVSVGGHKSQIHCLDLYQDLQIVSSHTFPGDLGVMDLDRNELKRALVAGCSDGTLRLLDGRMRGAEVAKIKSHAGGICAVATSHDGTLVATTGFTAKSGAASTNLGPYAFPDPNVLIYDIRYLGRGGIAHFFSGLKSSPRFVSFLPAMHDQPSNRFLVASGQPNGGLQILTPFEDTTENQSNFIFPLVDQGVSITCMTLSEQHVALGTSQGNVLQFELAGYIKHRTQGPINLTVDAAAFPSAREANFTSPSNTPSDIPPGKDSLVMPSSIAASPSVLICPTVLQSTHLGGMTGFSSFIMCGNPVVSKVGSRAESSFGPMAIKPMIPSPKRTVAETILSAGSRKDGDRGQIIATAAVDVSLHPRTTAMVRKGRKPWALRETRTSLSFRKAVVFMLHAR
ncbi:exonuclease [Fragilaria crotonensis]|nr:exonuclease [Fragilaria crotonensis]